MALPAGRAGTRATLDYMRRLVLRYKKTLPIRQLALSIIDRVRGRGHKNFPAQVRVLHGFVQQNIQYVKDISGVETLATPTKTLEYRQGDCDDQAVLLASLLESVGHATRFVAISMVPLGPFVHVYTETRLGPGWIPLETTEPWPAGKGPPKFADRMVVTNK